MHMQQVLRFFIIAQRSVTTKSREKLIDDKGEMYIPYTGCTRETNAFKSFVVKYNSFS